MQTEKTTSYLSLFDVNGTILTEIRKLRYVSSFDLNMIELKSIEHSVGRGSN